MTLEIITDNRFIGIMERSYTVVGIENSSGTMKVEYYVLKDLRELTERNVEALLRTLPVINVREEANKVLERNVMMI
jgi:hypothetical protein